MELFGLISIPRTVLIVCLKVSRSQSHSRQDPSREPEQGYGGLSCNNPHSWSNQRSGLASHHRVQPWASLMVSGARSRLVFDECLPPAQLLCLVRKLTAVGYSKKPVSCSNAKHRLFSCFPAISRGLDHSPETRFPVATLAKTAPLCGPIRDKYSQSLWVMKNAGLTILGYEMFG